MPDSRSSSQRQGCFRFIAYAALVIAALICCGMVALVGLGFWLIEGELDDAEQVIVATPTQTGQVLNAAPTTVVVTPLPVRTAEPSPPIVYDLQPPAFIEQGSVPYNGLETLNQLFAAIYPPRDYYQDEVRLGNSKPRPRTVDYIEYQVGDTAFFLTDDGEVEATLAAMNSKMYFWFADGASYSQTTLESVSIRAETELYPTTAALFGQEWVPGIDNDPRFHILHLSELESEELGYFTSGDTYPKEIFADSNEREIIYLNMDTLNLGDDYYYGTLVHELQHLIQWHQDSNEETWLDEGLAQLAEHVAGYGTIVVDDYLLAPNLQINSWDYDEEVLYNHYSASALFLIYFWEQLGDDAVRTLAQHPANGLASVEAVLDIYQPETTLDQFISDWYVANYIDNDQVAPAYAYQLPFRPIAPDVTVWGLPYSEVEDLAPFGVRYIEIPDAGQYRLSFAADTTAELMRADPHSGAAAWIAPGMNNVTASLTRAFDLTSLSEATLEFWLWRDLERDYDFAYVSVSTDGGQTWQVQAADSWDYGYYGPAVSGQEGWVKETIPLDRYAGRKILLRFEQLTDSSEFGQGVAIDDIAIPELGYLMDVEHGIEQWEAFGFVPAATILPQQWSVQVVYQGETPRVERLLLDGRNQLEMTLEVVDEATLVIAPVTPFTSDLGTYWLQLAPAN